MGDNWTEAKVQEFITSPVEESLTLGYKAAADLDTADGKKKEITKDVSAMANSAGRIIIYGISEFTDKSKRHLPEKIDPGNWSAFSKDWNM